MRLTKFLFFVAMFYFLVLLQQSFLPNFAIRGKIPNLLLILVFLNNFFSEKKEKSIWFAFSAGLLLDLFSSLPLGFFAFLFASSLILFQIFSQLFEKSDLMVVLGFIGFFIFYKAMLIFFILLLRLLSVKTSFVYFGPISLSIEIGYNLLVVLIFLGFKKWQFLRKT